MLPNDINELLIQDHDSLKENYPDLFIDDILISWLLGFTNHKVDLVLNHLHEQNIKINFSALALVNRSWATIPIIKKHIKELPESKEPPITASNTTTKKDDTFPKNHWKYLYKERERITEIINTYQQLQQKRLFRWISGNAAKDSSTIDGIRELISKKDVSSKSLNHQLEQLSFFNQKNRFRSWLLRVFFKSARALRNKYNEYVEHIKRLDTMYQECTKPEGLDTTFSSQGFRNHCLAHHILYLKETVDPAIFASAISKHWTKKEYDRIKTDTLPSYQIYIDASQTSASNGATLNAINKARRSLKIDDLVPHNWMIANIHKPDLGAVDMDSQYALNADGLSRAMMLFQEQCYQTNHQFIDFNDFTLENNRFNKNAQLLLRAILKSTDQNLENTIFHGMISHSNDIFIPFFLNINAEDRIQIITFCHDYELTQTVKQAFKQIFPISDYQNVANNMGIHRQDCGFVALSIHQEVLEGKLVYINDEALHIKPEEHPTYHLPKPSRLNNDKLIYPPKSDVIISDIRKDWLRRLGQLRLHGTMLSETKIAAPELSQSDLTRISASFKDNFIIPEASNHQTGCRLVDYQQFKLKLEHLRPFLKDALQKQYKEYVKKHKDDPIEPYDDFLRQFISEPHIKDTLSWLNDTAFADLMIIFKVINLNDYLKHALTKTMPALTLFCEENLINLIDEHHGLIFDEFFMALSSHDERLNLIIQWLHQHEAELQSLNLKTVSQFLVEQVEAIFNNTLAQLPATILEMPFENSLALVKLDNDEYVTDIEQIHKIPASAKGIKGALFNAAILGMCFLSQYEEKINGIIDELMPEVSAHVLALSLQDKQINEIIDIIQNNHLALEHKTANFLINQLVNQNLFQHAFDYHHDKNQIIWTPLTLSLVIKCIKHAGQTPLASMLSEILKTSSTHRTLSLDYNNTSQLLTKITSTWTTHLDMIGDHNPDTIIARRLMRTLNLGALGEMSHLFRALKMMPAGATKSKLFQSLLKQASKQMNLNIYGTFNELKSKIDQYKNNIDPHTGRLPDKRLEETSMEEWLIRGFSKIGSDRTTLIFENILRDKSSLDPSSQYIDIFDLKSLQQIIIRERLEHWKQVKNKTDDSVIDKNSRLTYELLKKIIKKLTPKYERDEWVIQVRSIVSRFEQSLTEAGVRHWPDDILTAQDISLLKVMNKIRLLTNPPDALKEIINIIDDNKALNNQTHLKITDTDKPYSKKELKTKLELIKSSCTSSDVTEIVLALIWLCDDSNKSSILSNIDSYLTRNGCNVLWIPTQGKHGFHMENYKKSNQNITQSEIYEHILNFVRSYVRIFELSQKANKLQEFINKNQNSICLEAATTNLFNWAAESFDSINKRSLPQWIDEQRQDLQSLADLYEDETDGMKNDRIAQWLNVLNQDQNVSWGGRFFQPSKDDFRKALSEKTIDKSTSLI